MTPDTRQLLLDSLPIQTGEARVRWWQQSDLDCLVAWPDYPFPYQEVRVQFPR